MPEYAPDGVIYVHGEEPVYDDEPRAWYEEAA